MPALFKQETSFKQAYLYSEVIYTTFGCEWACVGTLLLCMQHVFGVCIFGCTFPCTRIEKVAVSVFEKGMLQSLAQGDFEILRNRCLLPEADTEQKHQ